MPQAKQRPLSSFDARSVMLFAAITVGGGLAQAQTAPTTTRPNAPVKAASPAAAKTSSTSTKKHPAFETADKDKDGKLTRDETQWLSSLREGFDQYDTDKDGTISYAEFVNSKLYQKK
ncbi:EF-hand domain-containing protein [Acidovorax sp. MR-S7]|uniref:EF-hand domain-containing protein n=1 Tax=unclassified Acidovorax TaxID=2684926 RepID=UPI00039AA8F2|nr:EF-hand domain-containing protein [Acidovorax sp. MR-S7]GAD22699.1 hypothetical protein AVS7_02459 [Acidovorax sp. MR-S7]